MENFKPLIQAKKLSQSAEAIALQWVDEESGELKTRWIQKKFLRENAGEWEMNEWLYKQIQNKPEEVSERLIFRNRNFNNKTNS